MPKEHHNGAKCSARPEDSKVVLGTIPVTKLADHKENQDEPRQDPATEVTLGKCCIVFGGR